jgi:hypothetical protein
VYREDGPRALSAGSEQIMKNLEYFKVGITFNSKYDKKSKLLLLFETRGTEAEW